MIDEKALEAAAEAVRAARIDPLPSIWEGPGYAAELAKVIILAYEDAKPAAEPVAGQVYDGSIEVRLDDKGGVDEIVGLGVICHVERMSNGTWFMCLTRPDQTQEAFWLAGKGKVEVSHREHRTAPAVGPNVLPWSISAPASKDGG